MTFLDNLQAQNQFPIIFIGSGITQRYFNNAPTWDQLLQQLWSELRNTQSYYSKYNELHQEYGDDSFSIYTHLADDLESIYNTAFFDGHITIGDLTAKSAHDEGISPFRTRIAALFSTLSFKSSMKPELKLFKTMLSKARIIVTTNYDDFIEKQLNNAIKVRVGNRGLFESAGDLNELYKIHGSVKDPNSIMITSHDYQQMTRTSAIVNAKILSQLTESPIIFLGYSLTDKNIRSLLGDLADNMPLTVEEAAKRIGVVKYLPGQAAVNESIRDTDFGVHYTQVETDNYSAIYSAIAQIDQGFSPLEISKYQHALRQIIDVKGKRGQLKQVLTTFVDLEKLPQALKDRNLVVALGDRRYIYKFPDYVDYVTSYFLDEEPMPNEIALKFITKMSPKSPLPVSKYLQGKINLPPQNMAKLNARLARFSSLSAIQETVHIPHIAEEALSQYTNLSPLEIFNLEDDIKAPVKLAFFIEHLNYLDSTDVKSLIKHILTKQSPNFIKETNVRKLLMAYSLLTEPVLTSIK